MPHVLQFTITAIHVDTADCKTFFLQSLEKFTYKPGQFLPFIFNHNGREIRRSYSFSSSPHADDFISITIKRTANGEMSRWWMEEARPGTTLTSLMPAGMFTMEWQEKPRDIFLAAAGTGITPLYSILKSTLIKEPQSRIVLIYSNSNISSAIFYKELLNLAAKFPNQLIIEWLFSDALNIFDARLGTFNLQRIIARYLQYDISKATLFTCGPYYYMQVVEITCRSIGFAKQNIRKELFDIADISTEEKKYFDTTNRAITILFNGKKHGLEVPYYQSILTAALHAGIELPYSCRAGRCSTCKCKVLQGKIWMHYNEVLTDEDEANGYALTCTGHPASDGVIIEM